MHKLYVCMTTIPSRIKNIDKAIESLINQTVKPYKIILSIPKYYIRFKEHVDSQEILLLSQRFEKYKNAENENIVLINKIEKDYGPGTKLLGALKSREIFDIYSYIILVDDDVTYTFHFIEGFYKLILKNTIAASYYVYEMHNIKIGQGVDGFLIPCKYLNNFYRFFDIIKDYKNFIFHDDVYISYYLYLLNIAVLQIHTIDNKLCYEIYNDDNGLFQQFEYHTQLSRKYLNDIMIPSFNELLKRGVFEFIKKHIFYYKGKIILHL